jgi:hypothetical protein
MRWESRGADAGGGSRQGEKREKQTDILEDRSELGPEWTQGREGQRLPYEIFMCQIFNVHYKWFFFC